MPTIEEILKAMDFEFFGTGQHKIPEEKFLARKDAFLLDLRTHEEARAVALPLAGLLPGRHIPLQELPDRAAEVPRDKLVGLFCSSGTRAAMAYVYLRTLGYENVRILVGGYGPFLDSLKPGKLHKLLSARQGDGQT